MSPYTLIGALLLACSAMAQGSQVAEDEDYRERPPSSPSSTTALADRLDRLERDTAISMREWVLLLIQRERESTELLIQRERDAINALDALIKSNFHYQERALVVASEAMTIRLEHSNNLIDAAQQKEAEYARKSETESAISDLERRLTSVEQYRAAREGERAGGQPLSTIVMLIVGAVITGAVGLVFLWFSTRREVSTRGAD